MSISDFSILEKLGQGSYAKVYKVMRLTDNKIYALKQINLQKLDSKSRQNALNQIRFLASFSSKNIVKYYEAFVEEKEKETILCIVMEYAENGDLNKLIQAKKQKNEKFFEAEIWKCLISLIHGLGYLHERSILHRDIKPQNIFISNGQYKIGDLNVSRTFQEQAQKKLTQIGTPFYASPQIWQNVPYNNKCDVWSLGCLIYQMATFSVPFCSKSMDKLYHEIISSNPKPIPKHYSNQLTTIINKCLQKQPNKRPSIKELQENFTIRMYENLYYTSQQLQLELEKSKHAKESLLKTISFPKSMGPQGFKQISLPLPSYQQQQKQPVAQVNNLKAQPVPKQNEKVFQKICFDNESFFSSADKEKQKQKQNIKLLIKQDNQKCLNNNKKIEVDEPKSKMQQQKKCQLSKQIQQDIKKIKKQGPSTKSTEQRKELKKILEPSYRVETQINVVLNKNNKNRQKSVQRQAVFAKNQQEGNTKLKNLSNQLMIKHQHNADNEKLKISQNRRSLPRTQLSAKKLQSIEIDRATEQHKQNQAIRRKLSENGPSNNNSNIKQAVDSRNKKSIRSEVENSNKKSGYNQIEKNNDECNYNYNYNYKNLLVSKLAKNSNQKSLNVLGCVQNEDRSRKIISELSKQYVNNNNNNNSNNNNNHHNSKDKNNNNNNRDRDSNEKQLILNPQHRKQSIHKQRSKIFINKQLQQKVSKIYTNL